MSKMELFGKGSHAVGSVLGSIGKFEAKNPDGSVNAVKVVSGVADIVDSIGNFLPPPASLITGPISSIFNIFTAAPSTTEVIKKEFEKQEKFINEKFAEQQEFISQKAEELKWFVADQFRKQNKFLSKKFEEQKLLIDDLKIPLQTPASKTTLLLTDELVMIQPNQY